MNKRLVVIPSDPIHEYEAKGTSSWLKDYYNPMSYFDEVYVLSPIEKTQRDAYGLKIIAIKSDRHYRKLLKEINPLCVRAYGGYWATDYANYNRVRKIPVVSSIHDTNPKLMYEGLKFSDDFFAMSNGVINVLKKKFNTKNVKILGNRVDTSKFSNKDQVDNPLNNRYKNKKIILNVGRKSFEKNIETVIKSMSYLSSDYILIMIGKGEIENYIKIGKEYNVDERLFFIEKIENDQLVNWYNIAHVFCVPSRWEGFGLVFAEAASCVTKIVTSNIQPMNEYLINDGIMNILVDDFENPKAISNAILNLTKNPNKNNETRKLIIENFDKKIIAKREIEFYKNVTYTKKNKKLDFKIWYYKWFIKKEIIPFKNKVIKLPKRIWKKLLSYL